MNGFWVPFVFGLSWLALALLFLWLLQRAPEQRLALRSRAARVLAGVLVALPLSIFVIGLPFSLGFCRGGFDEPVRCSVLPAGVVDATSALSLLLVIAGLFAAPVLAAGVLILEALKRR